MATAKNADNAKNIKKTKTFEAALGRIELLLAGDRNGPIESKPFFEDEAEGGTPDDGRLPF